MLNNKGFSLIEILIVLAIIGIFAFIGVPSLMRTLSTAKIKATKLEMQTIRSVLTTYYTEYDKYPKSIQKLVDEKFIGPEVLKDGWNNPYNYRPYPDDQNNPDQKYDIISNGKDGIFGNDDDLKVTSEIE
ncbi:MAG: type II secretion system protein GspG [Spirochaetes bacterium]|nr:type II secretion system protein GspG [Spirochaetota bacterium]